ncbi:MAG: hypothetical protein EXX96DRAFT_588269 [Benjaminiella poitrasii]|nr:MAG: hypothetical protein EXX96DRAFT_588269 [Benjaminiella poitrasii]
MSLVPSQKFYHQQLFPDPTLIEEEHNSNKRKHDKRIIEDRENEILAFGYECKIYNDKDAAIKVQNGKFLIHWKNMEENSLLMDRYDVRHLIENINDLIDIKQPEQSNKSKLDELLDAERFANIYEQNVVEEEQSFKKSKNTATIAYDYNNDGITEKQSDSYNEFEKSISLKYKTPSSMVVPSTEKQLFVIEDVAKQANSANDSNLFEIRVQVKNSRNSLYCFLNKHDPLYAFYKHVQWLLRLGNYYSSSEEEEEINDMPPPEIQQIIDKTAEYISKSSKGTELEKHIKLKKGNDPKFAFLHPGHKYHTYYRTKIDI